MKYIFLTLAIHILFAQYGFCSKGSISGQILQIDSITVIQGVSVYLEQTKYGTSTNSIGSYRIDGIEPGDYTLIASCVGYFTQKQRIRVDAGINTALNFTLVETISTLPGITVMTGGEARLREIPGSVQYISPRELQKFLYTDVNRTLRNIPGINMQEEDGFGLRPNIGLRGSGVERTSRITIMEDGVLMAPAPYAAPAAYYFPTMGRIQGVEILKGSSQIKYGPYTTGGAINMISTQIPDQLSGRLSILAGSYGFRSVHAHAGNSHKNVGYMVETFQYGADGFKELDNGGNTGFNKEDYLAKIKLNTNADAKVYQSLLFKIGQSKEVSNETYLGLTQEDFDLNHVRRYAGSQMDKMTTEHNQFSLTHYAEFSKFLNIKTTAYHSDFSRNWYKLDVVKNSEGRRTGISGILDNPMDYTEEYGLLTGNSSINNDALEVKANNRNYYSRGIQTILSSGIQTDKVSHNIDFGLRFHQDQEDRFQWVDKYAMDAGVMKLSEAGVPGTESNRIEQANAFASYLQYRLQVGKFTAIPGIRYELMEFTRDDYGKNDIQRTGAELNSRSNRVDEIIPGVGLEYVFNESLSTFLGIHKGFAPPGSTEDTKPEQSINYEIGGRYNRRVFSGQAIFFLNRYSNLLGADFASSGGGGTGDLFNAGEARTTGLELQASYDLLSGGSKVLMLPLSLAYTYTNGVFLSDFVGEFADFGTVQSGDQYPYLAPNQLSVMLGLEHYLFDFNVSTRYMDAMRTTPGQGTIPADEKTDAYFVVDISGNYKVNRSINIFSSLTNITNSAYMVARRPAGVRPGMPRAINIGISANF